MGVQPIAIAVHPEPKLGTRSDVPRALDVAERVFAAVLLLLAFPFLATVALITAALSGQSPFVAHRRVGRNGQTIWVIKLRTMWERRAPCYRRMTLVERLVPECGVAIEIKSREDPRVTSRFASLCRRYSIDEVPQLWHVLCGEMSLVGPRPLTAQELHEHYGSVLSEVLSVKPGVTGLWQVRGRSRLSYGQRRRLDLVLVRNWSLDLYLSILMRTIPAVIAGKNAW